MTRLTGGCLIFAQPPAGVHLNSPSKAQEASSSHTMLRRFQNERRKRVRSAADGHAITLRGSITANLVLFMKGLWVYFPAENITETAEQLKRNNASV